MKVMIIALMILRVSVVLALILGILFWVNPAIESQALQGIHMLLGIIVVLALWVVGLAQGRLKGGSFGLAVGTFIIGLAVAILGLSQVRLKAAGVNVELIDVIHLLLGLTAAGFGEMIAGRVKRQTRAAAA